MTMTMTMTMTFQNFLKYSVFHEDCKKAFTHESVLQKIFHLIVWMYGSIVPSICALWGQAQIEIPRISPFIAFVTKVVYMCSSLVQLSPGSRDLSQAEKGIAVSKADNYFHSK